MGAGLGEIVQVAGDVLRAARDRLNLARGRPAPAGSSETSAHALRSTDAGSQPASCAIAVMPAFVVANPSGVLP